LTQTNSDLEVILVNDGSTDKSLEICECFAVLDKRIKIISQKNAGLSAARNTGMRFASGDYFCFIDSDDSVDNGMMEAYHKVILTNTPDIVTTNIFQYQKGNVIYTETKNDLPYEKLLDKNIISNYFLKPFYGGELGIISAAWNKCYKKQLIQEHNLVFDETLKRSEDYWFNFYAFQKADKVYCINKSYYHYFANTGSMIRSLREGQFQAFLNNRTKLLNEHHKFDFPIDWMALNNKFVHNINELILLEINVKGLLKAHSNVKNYLQDEIFLEIYANSNILKKHVKLIKYLLGKNYVEPAIIIFYIWSFKAK
jgi:glycosyltransferase involved in cell wall biosynthesis